MTAILRSARSTGTVLGENPQIQRGFWTMIPQPLIMLLFLDLTIPVVVLLAESILRCQNWVNHIKWMRASGLGVGFVLSELGFPTSFLQMQGSGSAIRRVRYNE